MSAVRTAPAASRPSSAAPRRRGARGSGPRAVAVTVTDRHRARRQAGCASRPAIEIALEGIDRSRLVVEMTMHGHAFALSPSAAPSSRPAAYRRRFPSTNPGDRPTSARGGAEAGDGGPVMVVSPSGPEAGSEARDRSAHREARQSTAFHGAAPHRGDTAPCGLFGPQWATYRAPRSVRIQSQRRTTCDGDYWAP